MTVLEYIVRSVAIIVMVFGGISAGLALLLTPPGLMAAFVAAFALMAAVGSGLALLAMDLLYPEVMTFSGIWGFLWLVVSASLASVILFDMVLEGIVLKLLKRTGLDLPHIRMIEAFLGGVFLGLALIVAARFLPDTSLSPAAALAAGLISSFVRYYLGLWFDGVLVDDGAQFSDEMD